MRIYNPAPGFVAKIPYGIYCNQNKIFRSRGLIYDGIMDVICAQDGLVVRSGFSNNLIWGMGYFLLVKHANDLYTFYAYGAHPSSFKRGDMIAIGDHVFRSGQTGKAKRPQFYFQVRTGRLWIRHVDPFSYIHGLGLMPGILPPEQQKLRVTGKINKKTWKALQEALKSNRTWGYGGLTDGVPKKDTWKALLESASLFYTGTEKEPSKKNIILAVQRKLYSQGFMEEHESGRWDKQTVSSLQRVLNSGDYC